MSDNVISIVLVAVVAAGALGWLAVSLGFIPPPWAETVVRIGKRRVWLKRGQLRTQARDDLAEVLSGFGIENGFIAISAIGQVSFSRNLPRAIHQRLRNVLLN